MTAQAPKALVVFDLVSTLTDAGPRYVRAFADVCAAHGYPVPPDAEILDMLGNKSLPDIMRHFVGELPEEARKLFMQDCNNTCDALLHRPDWEEHLFPHVREAVETLGLMGVTLGIYTGTREDALSAQLDYHDLRGFFDPQYIRGKDNIRDAGIKTADLKAAQLVDIVAAFRRDAGDNAVIVVIGDSAADAAAAAKLGLDFAGFAPDARKKAQMEAAGVQHIMRDFADLPDFVMRFLRPAGNDNPPPEKKPEISPRGADRSRPISPPSP
jgi:phosphoglycolate phosphatase-like HAD superfamily hydrolase